MSLEHKPKAGDKVNDIRRVAPFQNGFVKRILYDDGPDTVVVKFDNGTELYDYDEFRTTWTHNYGGVFILGGEPISPKLPTK